MRESRRLVTRSPKNGATAPAEFFAVACEAFFVDRARFALEFPTLEPLLAALFKPATRHP